MNHHTFDGPPEDPWENGGMHHGFAIKDGIHLQIIAYFLICIWLFLSIYVYIYLSLSLGLLLIVLYIYILNIFDFNVHPLHSCMLDLYLKSHEVGDDISQAVKRFCHFCFSEEVRWWDAEANGKGRFSNETNEVVAWMFVPLSKSLIVSHL